jgi:hypothetical protein
LRKVTERLARNRPGLWRVDGVVTVNGEITSPPEIDAGLAAAALAVFAHRHEVVHLLYAATDEPDALTRIGGLLRVDEATIARVLDQPFRWMLPQFRTELESIAVAPPTLTTPATRTAPVAPAPLTAPVASAPLTAPVAPGTLAAPVASGQLTAPVAPGQLTAPPAPTEPTPTPATT